MTSRTTAKLAGAAGLVAAISLAAGSTQAESAGIVRIKVPARERWTDSGVSVVAGQILPITASGRWIDRSNQSGPEGYPSDALLKPFEGWRRVKDAPWFALIGCVGRTTDHCFVVSRCEAGACEAPASGRLYFFANDVSFMYWNNRGAIDVTVETAPLP